VQQVSGQSPEVIGLPLVGDAGLYANENLLIPVYYGPGYETAHSDHEQVSVERLTHCAKVYAAVMMSYCSVVT
jgi:acetylornithine deacetylase/succinyl-diaminopimelate desuccinylase-like protein